MALYVAPYNVADTIDLIFHEIVVARQVDGALIERIADFVRRFDFEHWQHRERPEEDSCIDVVRTHVTEQSFAIELNVAIHNDRGHPVAIDRTLGLGIHRERQSCETRLIFAHNLSTALDQNLDALQLCTSERRLNV